MKKTYILVLGIIIFSGCLFFTNNFADAQIVPCGLSADNPATTEVYENCSCTFCHFFSMIKNIMDFVITYALIPIGVLILVLSGIVYMFGHFGESPVNLQQANKMIFAVVIGLVIIFASWLILNLIFTGMGIMNPALSWNPANWFQPCCPVPNAYISPGSCAVPQGYICP